MLALLYFGCCATICSGFAPKQAEFSPVQQALERDRTLLQTFPFNDVPKLSAIDAGSSSGRKLSDLDCINTCWNDFSSRACAVCIDDNLKLTQLSTSYTTDMLQFKLGTGYTKGWCGKRSIHPEEGVDTDLYPGGWMPSGNGSFTGCEIATDFPGLNSTSHMSHAYVKEEMKKLPALQESGQVWRGNELGFIISNEIFWPENISPRSVLLGAAANQHKVFRPILDRLFSNCDDKCEQRLSDSAFSFQQEKTSLNVQKDIKIWVHQELFKTAFPEEENPVDVEEFVATQGSLTTLSTISQLFPDWAGNLAARGVINSLKDYFNKYRTLVEKHYGLELSSSDCSPSTSCVDQFASALLDTMLAAGGLSVPSAISTGLWVMYGQTFEYDDTFPQEYRLDNADPLPFFYESMRFFAPVVGLPWWTTPPARATDPAGSQVEGGVRKVLNLALANKDPNAWGEDAHKFRVKSLDEYHKHFVGFADFAVDDKVAGGQMNRKCPGKDLALKMGKAFFKNWDQSEWVARGKSYYTETTPFVDEFVLERPKAKAFWDNVWSDIVQRGFLLVGTDGRFDAYSRAFSAINSFEVLSWTRPMAKAIPAPELHEPSQITVPVGLAKEVEVPKTDEIWPDVDDQTAFAQSLFAKLLTFPETADQCGEWQSDENPERVTKEHLFTGLNEARILVPWNDEKYTDEGFEDLVFSGIGQHRIRRVKAQDPNKEGAAYAVYLGVAETLSTKPGFAKLGADAYFDANGKVLHIYRGGKTYYPRDGATTQGWAKYTDYSLSTTECDEVNGESVNCKWWEVWGTCRCDVPARVGWKHAKMAFLGTLSAFITAVDHLYGLHLVVANSMVTASVEELTPDHPLRQLMHPFSFRTAAINYQAAISLVNEFGLIHRAMPLNTEGLRQLYTYAREESAGLTWAPILKRHQRQNVSLPLPLFEDGDDFYSVVQTFVRSYLSEHFDYASNTCGSDELIQAWHVRVNSIAPNHDLPTDDLTCEHLEELIATMIYMVTGAHTHVGSIVSEMEDPCHMPWAWREGELCATPRTAYTTTVIFALTSLEQPKLMDDYSHVFAADASKQIWNDFQENLKAYASRVQQRNSKRKRPFMSFDMEVMEVSVAI